MTVLRVCAVAFLVVSFNFFAAFFTLKRWHNSSKQKTAGNNNNFAREELHIKATASMVFNGVEKASATKQKRTRKSCLPPATSQLSSGYS
jgi:predicted component of type VI protein secretion system